MLILDSFHSRRALDYFASRQISLDDPTLYHALLPSFAKLQKQPKDQKREGEGGGRERTVKEGEKERGDAFGG